MPGSGVSGETHADEGSGFLQAWNHPSPHWLLTLGRWLMLSEHRDMRFKKKKKVIVLRP